MAIDRFEFRWLRWSTAISVFAPAVWWLLLAYDHSLGDDFFLRYALMPLWIALLPACAYYAHLLAARLRLSLGAFVVLVIIWGNATAVAGAQLGWKAGVTAALGVSALFLFAITWGLSVARFLGCQGLIARAAIIVLGACIPLSVLTILVCAWMSLVAYLMNDYAWLVGNAAAILVSLALLIGAMVLHRRAREAAGNLIAQKPQHEGSLRRPKDTI